MGYRDHHSRPCDTILLGPEHRDLWEAISFLRMLEREWARTRFDDGVDRNTEVLSDLIGRLEEELRQKRVSQRTPEILYIHSYLGFS